MATDKAPHAPLSQPDILSERDLAIVRAIADYRFMQAIDVVYSLATPKQLPNYRRRLAVLCGGDDLCHAEILLRFPVPTLTRGEKPRVYHVGAKGWDLLASEGYYRPYKLKNLSFAHIWHALTLTRFVCAAEYYCRTHAECMLTRKKLAYELARNPPTVTLRTEGRSLSGTVVPDAYLCFEQSNGKNWPILLEIDRGTEYQERFKDHVRARLELILSGTFARVFQTQGALVAYAAAGEPPESRERRRMTMQRWTQEVIAERMPNNVKRQQQWLSIFRFCSLPEDIYTSVNALFGEPCWYTPNSPCPVPFFTPPQVEEEI
jgi:hypothetical protein